MPINDWNLYFITDKGLSKKTILQDISSALLAGVKVVQLRDKDASDKEFFQLALKVKELCKKSGADLIINDRADIALAVDADGVHLGQDELPLKQARKILGKKIIGVTVHNLKEVKKAQKEGANYLGVSPIFETTTKLDAGPTGGLELLLKVRKATSLHLTAIGGINHSNLKQVVLAGADSVAMISAIIAKEDVCAQCKKAIQIIAKYKLKKN